MNCIVHGVEKSWTRLSNFRFTLLSVSLFLLLCFLPLLPLSCSSHVRLCATHRLQPTRLPRPWDSPGKNTGVGCHFLLQCVKVKSGSEVAQSSPTLATPWTTAYQAPLSMGFSRQEYWSGLPFSICYKAGLWCWILLTFACLESFWFLHRIWRRVLLSRAFLVVGSSLSSL